MYFNKTNNFFHGIIFHHFHDNHIHPKGQGTISKNEFVDIINFIGRKNILDAHPWPPSSETQLVLFNEKLATTTKYYKVLIHILL